MVVVPPRYGRNQTGNGLMRGGSNLTAVQIERKRMPVDQAVFVRRVIAAAEHQIPQRIGNLHPNQTRPKRPCFGRLQPRPPAPSNSSRTLNRPMRPTAARPARPSTRRYRLFSAPCGTSLFLIVPKLLYFRQYCKTFCIVIRREHVDRQGHWD